MGALMVLIDAAGAVETWAWRRGHARTERVMRAVWLRLLCEAAARGLPPLDARKGGAP